MSLDGGAQALGIRFLALPRPLGTVKDISRHLGRGRLLLVSQECRDLLICLTLDCFTAAKRMGEPSFLAVYLSESEY